MQVRGWVVPRDPARAWAHLATAVRAESSPAQASQGPIDNVRRGFICPGRGPPGDKGLSCDGGHLGG